MNKTLYRDPVNGKIAGVCAGIAEFFGVEVNLVRLAVIAIAIFSMGFLAVIAYVAAVFILEKKPNENAWQQTARGQNDGPSQEGQLLHIEQRIGEMEAKVAHMEAYVTSSEFDLNRKFKQL